MMSTADAPSVISIEGLRKVYREGWLVAKRFEALRGVSLDVPSGEVFGLLGPNGAGKTTLIKILLGIIYPTSGKATVLGQAAGSMAARMRIGYLPENLNVPKHMRAIEAIRFYGRLNRVPESEIRKRENELLELVGLKGKERWMVSKFSKGMRQRVGLAQAMIHDPEILIMDEPTDGLDPVGRGEIRSIIERLKGRGKTIFLNSHILQEVEMICDRVAILVQGQMRTVGRIHELSKELQKTRASSETEFSVVGSPEQIEHVVASRFDPTDFRFVASQPNQSDQKLICKFQNQTEVDALVDALRGQGISILAIHPRQAKLEDVFFEMVAASESPEPTQSAS